LIDTKQKSTHKVSLIAHVVFLWINVETLHLKNVVVLVMESMPLKNDNVLQMKCFDVDPQEDYMGYQGNFVPISTVSWSYSL
jgi:hypothetical protein